MWSTLRESFGLTPAEIRLAALLREGKTLKDASDELSVSINTVRNQLRAVFDKLGLKRQSDLIRALTELSQVSGALGELSPGQAGATPEIRFVTLPDRRRLAYREYGVPRGRNLLLFHEGLGSSLLPEGAQVLAAQLGLRVISAERPGFGQSDPHPDYSFDAVAEDMAELCDLLGLTDIRIAAILSGAASALTTGIHLGSRVRSILLCSGRPPRPTSRASSLMTRFRARLEAHPWVLDTFYTILRIRLSAGLIEGMIRTATTNSPGDRALLKDSPWMVNYMAAYVSECLARTAKGSTDEIRAFHRGGNLTPVALAAPLTVWHGADDQFAPLSDLQEFLGEKPYDLKVFPDVGHLLAVKVWDQILRHAAA
jgi:pimeloyl-ACP methyl ester carboxylesterase/DNA-binding CsgD family transcriptional regulator